jgi:hypothetical protein
MFYIKIQTKPQISSIAYFWTFQKVLKSNFKPKPKVENDFEIPKNPKISDFGILVKHDIFGLSKKF